MLDWLPERQKHTPCQVLVGSPDSPRPSGCGLSIFFFCPLTNISRPGCTSKSGNLKKTQALVTQVVESPCNAGDLNSIPGSGRSAGEVNGNPLQYSCLENSMIEEPWGCKKSDTTERLTHEPEDVGSRLTIHPERWL